MHGPKVTEILESMKRVKNEISEGQALYLEQVQRVHINPNDLIALQTAQELEGQLIRAVNTFNRATVFIHEVAAVN